VAYDIAKRLLARVKSLRLSLGLSQEAFAEKVGLGYKYYQSVEAGRRRDLRLSTLEKLAKGCDLRLWQLLNFDADSPIPEQNALFHSAKTARAKYRSKTPHRRANSKKA
jgi:transcriptional regulator with XRE-family HTH domain